MAKAKEKITIKINWSAIARVAIAAILTSAIYSAYATTEESQNDDSSKE